MPIEIPITFVGDDFQATENRVLGSPCIRVALFAEHERRPGGEISASSTWALLDTGADYFYVDHSLIEQHKAPKVGDVAANGVVTTLHSLCIHIPDDGFTFIHQVVARDIIGQGQPFRVILGREFFRSARIEFDLREGQFPRLVFYGNERSSEG